MGWHELAQPSAPKPQGSPAQRGLAATPTPGVLLQAPSVTSRSAVSHPLL